MHLAKKYTGSIYSISLINLDLKQRGWGNKTGPFDYLGYPIPLFGGELGKQDSYVSKGGPLVGEDDFGKPLHLGNGCNLINWQD